MLKVRFTQRWASYERKLNCSFHWILDSIVELSWTTEEHIDHVHAIHDVYIKLNLKSIQPVS